MRREKQRERYDDGLRCEALELSKPMPTRATSSLHRHADRIVNQVNACHSGEIIMEDAYLQCWTAQREHSEKPFRPDRTGCRRISPSNRFPSFRPTKRRSQRDSSPLTKARPCRSEIRSRSWTASISRLTTIKD